MMKCWVCKQVGSLKVQEMVEHYFGEGIGIGFDTVCVWDSMDACISWTIVQNPIGSEVQIQLYRNQDYMDGSEQVDLVKQGRLVERMKHVEEF